MKLLLFTSQGISRKLTEFFSRRKDVELTVVTQSTTRDRIYGYEPVAPYCERAARMVLERSEFFSAVRKEQPRCHGGERRVRAVCS